MTRLSQERATRTAEREEKALNIPMREHPPEQFSFTPKEVLIRETLTNVSTGLITSLQQKYLSDVGRIIETGLVNGASRTEIAQQITDLSSNLLWQSERIVRTETIRAFNTNMRHRLESDGVKYWQWIASAERVEGGVGQAKRTCDVCWQLNGMIVNIGDPFMIHRGTVIRQPPDPHPNCRCTVRAATTRDYDEFHGFKEREPTVTQESVGQLIEMIKKIPRRIA
jgi:SPP1 gp7 family putative phage head morphogenesis protein